jgi:sporulation protein YlmC with PRC-barrel domain
VTSRHQVCVQDLLGRPVVAKNGRRVGRLEELRVDPTEGSFDVLEFVIGTGGLLERLSVRGTVFGRRATSLVARWDQIDISDPTRPTLTCSVDELESRSNRGDD